MPRNGMAIIFRHVNGINKFGKLLNSKQKMHRKTRRQQLELQDSTQFLVSTLLTNKTVLQPFHLLPVCGSQVYGSKLES